MLEPLSLFSFRFQISARANHFDPRKSSWFFPIEKLSFSMVTTDTISCFFSYGNETILSMMNIDLLINPYLFS